MMRAWILIGWVFFVQTAGAKPKSGRFQIYGQYAVLEFAGAQGDIDICRKIDVESERKILQERTCPTKTSSCGSNDGVPCRACAIKKGPKGRRLLVFKYETDCERERETQGVNKQVAEDAE
ncbi:MAG: hypothetical protein AB7P04_15365 [Bacteriovoracia bacterium]